MGKQNKQSSAPSAASTSASATTASAAKGTTAGAKANNARAKIVKTGNAGNSSNATPLNSTAARAQQAIDEGRPPPLFPVGYKTPISLLNERCQKNGWQKPDIQPFKLPGGGHSCIIRLSRQDPKAGLETVTFRPPTTSSSTTTGDSQDQILADIVLDKPTSLEAKHWGAVYALHRFASALQLGMVLPPQCRGYWAALQAHKKYIFTEAAKNKNKSVERVAWQWDENPFEAAQAQKARLEAFKANTTAQPDTPHNGHQVASGSRSTPGSGNASATTSGRNTPISGPNNMNQHGPSLPKDTPEVKMSAEMRKLVQETIRKMRELRPPAPPDAAIGGEAGPSTAFILSKEEHKDAVAGLQSIGYRKGHIESALAYFQTPQARYDPLLEGLSKDTVQETVLQYLQITLSEEELPDQMNNIVSSHRSTNGKRSYQGTPDANIRITRRHDNEHGLARSWIVDKIVKEAGYPEKAVSRAVESAEGEEARTFAILLRKLAGWQADFDETITGNRDNLDKEDIKLKRETEIEALESLLGNAVQRKGQHLLEIRLASSGATLLLNIMLHPSTNYPSPVTPEQSMDNNLLPIPTFYISNINHANGVTAIPGYIRLHLTFLVLDKIATDWRDIIEAGEGGVIYEMATFLQEIVDKVLHHPPPSADVLRLLEADTDLHLSNGMSDLSMSGAGKSRDKRTNQNRQGGGGQPAPLGDNASLLEQFKTLQETIAYQSMLSKRRSLPAQSSRQALIDLISSNRVVIVSGATGSGKTTQVPAYVLEDAIQNMRGEQTNMIITQPRRISAIGVASRVAQERCEELGKDGTLVGYAIRGERKASRQCRMLFCTTGILLQRLSRGGDPDLKNVSHVFVDEVHERSLDSDFLLLMLKEVLARNKNIKVILMSATADSNRFSAYFDNAPCIEIPGQTFPVRDLYLEDVIQSTQYRAPSTKASRKYSDQENEAIRSSLLQQGLQSQDLISTLAMLIRAERIDYDLIAATVSHIDNSYDAEEAILVFVTGVAEITQTIRAIERLPSATRGLVVLPLHANLTNAEQSRIFKNAPPGKRKVIVSTNVAETSITVDDVVHVIDTGRVKETRFDPISSVQRLVEDWNSLAGSRQRRGRAGRTKPGYCWRMYSRYQEESVIPKYTTPEILRTPLASLVLQVKALRGRQDVVRFLGGALDAPDVQAIHEALQTLQDLGAIEESSSISAQATSTPITASTADLTPLGRNLALLPLDLRLGKMLVLASLFGCLEPMLYICAALSTKPLFSAPPEARNAASAARQRFATGHSDILTDLNAIRAILRLDHDGVERSYSSKLRQFFDDNYVSPSAWREILSLKADYISAMKNAGFVVKSSEQQSKSPPPVDASANDNLLKAIVYAGTGRAVRVRLPQVRYESTIGGTTQIDHEAKEVRFFDGDAGRVFLHPSSVLFSESKLKNGYLTYFNKSVTTKPYLRDATELPLYALLLFGRGLSADPVRGGLSLGADKIRLRAPPRTSVLINELRRLLDLELEDSIDNPGATEDLINGSIVSLITGDGS